MWTPPGPTTLSPPRLCPLLRDTCHLLRSPQAVLGAAHAVWWPLVGGDLSVPHKNHRLVHSPC